MFLLALDKQVKILNVDTSNFYSKRERRLHMLNHKLRAERNRLVNGGFIVNANGVKRTITGTRQLESQLAEFGVDVSDIKLMMSGEYDFSIHGDDADTVNDIAVDYAYYKSLAEMKTKKANEVKQKLLSLLSNKVEANDSSNQHHHIRKLDESTVSEDDVIAVFDSYFTRTIGAEIDGFTDDFMIVRVFYFDVLKDLIFNGFTYKGERYIYFTSSAGQIRTKKCVFVKESVWRRCEKSIMCGLTLDDINAKGGINPNKYLAYNALSNSATDVWEEFDIDKCIVIDDFATEVYGTYDFVSDVDYSVTRECGHREIEHTDGAGMMLPNAFGILQNNKMVRIPWIKGLLCAFPFDEFIRENGCSPIIKDIYGEEHDVIDEDIQVIFTKSQFKLSGFYDSWDDYKEKYHDNGCTAGFTNEEEERIKDATINYQMLQSLTDITDDEIASIARQSVYKLDNMCSSIRNVKSMFDITPYNKSKTAFQKCIELYPELINDEYTKSHIRRIKDSIIKRCKAGKLDIHGKYTFVVPDFYAACEHWFMGIDNPNGLLDDGEVFCWLFRKNEELDCLRSPHLFLEHAIRKNVAARGVDEERRDKLRNWYCTDAVYTSCKDLISRVLQFDCDGDKLLMVADKTIIDVAKRNIEKFDIVPLYYDMKKASPVHLDNKAIYAGLNAAFVGGNIGIYSNNISKIWNSDVFVDGTLEEQKEAVELIKILCMENNYVIDNFCRFMR